MESERVTFSLPPAPKRRYNLQPFKTRAHRMRNDAERFDKTAGKLGPWGCYCTDLAKHMTGDGCEICNGKGDGC